MDAATPGSRDGRGRRAGPGDEGARPRARRARWAALALVLAVIVAAGVVRLRAQQEKARELDARIESLQQDRERMREDLETTGEVIRRQDRI